MTTSSTIQTSPDACPDAGFADQNMRPLIIDIKCLLSALSTVPSGPKLVPISAPAPVVSAPASALVALTDFSPVPVLVHNMINVVVISRFCNGEVDRTYITDVPTCNIVELSVCNVGATAVGNSDKTSVKYQALQLPGMFFRDFDLLLVFHR